MYRRIYVLELFTVMYIGGMTDKAGLALDAKSDVLFTSEGC